MVWCSADHLKYGQSEYLCQSLSSVYSAILTYCYVPTTFTHGVIIPVLKKSTLNSNVAANYRPITISSTFSKLLGPIQTKDARFFRRVLSVPEHSHLSRKTLDAA